MSSDEDFAIVKTPQPSEDTLEEIQSLITIYKKKYDQLLQEQKELDDARIEVINTAQQFKQRTMKLTEEMKKDQQMDKELLEKEKRKLYLLKEEESKLMQEIQNIQSALKEEDDTLNYLQQQNDVCAAMPEKKLVFTGHTQKPDNTHKFEMKARIIYPMDEGTALVTFEEEDVARKILQLKKHQVKLGDECRITLEAQKVHLMLPSLLEVESEVCPHRILISNLPQIDANHLKDRLEIHFSKRRNNGGEVETCEMLPDSGNVVLTFVENNVAKRLIEIEYHEVRLEDKNHRVRVTPFLNGKIMNLETKMSVCPRTVLLTGIPDVMEQDTMQDVLEIHFQKTANGGGEIEAFLYNPLGQQALALFEDISPDEK